MKNKTDEFNIVIVGVGGQGLLTILQIIAEAALSEGYEVRTSELHGLAQRGGSVEVHIRFGKRIFSPLVAYKKADLIIALEMQEALLAGYFANEKTKFLVNKHAISVPLLEPLKDGEVMDNLKKISNNVSLIPASEICQKEFNTDVVAGIYLLGIAVVKNMLPLKQDSIILAIKKIIPARHLELNLKVFELTQK